LIDGLDNVLIALRGDGAAHVGVNVEFTPAEADELAGFVMQVADFLRELEAGIRAAQGRSGEPAGGGCGVAAW
jgi:hypothetical protein